ncbi:unnamed protein product [Cylindrotheca closterium]|uniref:Uncharacterized protein n=1 Tax=Cylindrotheca closterium TaxID=2856 RepID=A0AAD2FCR5_9STRA|nr:unnamed protein product [Cylindrotheca closterium]
MAGSTKKQKGNLRNRKRNEKESKTKDAGPPEENNNKTVEEDDQSLESNQTIWETIRRHPLFWGFVLLGIPYGSYLIFRWVVLQHPFLSSMRPPVALSDERQVLILGSMSSGTSSIAADLRGHQILEVGHEDTDATWKFVRDGTVSWFHGIRFISTTDDADKVIRIAKTCAVSWLITSKSISGNHGFGPTLFGNPEYECSFWNPYFRKCYLSSCHKALLREFGCALEPEGCQTPYKKTLLQTREPWKIITSLSAKYCYKNGKIDDSAYPETLQRLLSSVGWVSANDPPLSCPTQMMEYVVSYYSTILEASKSIDITVYPIENASLCDVARMAGLDSPETTIWQDNHHKYQSMCNGEDIEGTETTPRAKSNEINKGRVSKEDLQPYATPALLKQIDKLHSKLGYAS